MSRAADEGATGLFRLALPDGSIRLATGPSRAGPRALLGPDVSLTGLLQAGDAALAAAVDGPTAGDIPIGATVQAPIESQEVWAAGVTYRRSHEARVDESTEPTVYDRVYDAERPELFFKAAGWRVRGPGEPIGVRADSTWDVPEPELVLVLTPTMAVAGYVLGDDVSSRSIEGDNPLYLPQAKVYSGSCAIGPAIVPAARVSLPVELELHIERDGATAFRGSTSTGMMRRTPDELASWLGRALAFPDGAFLLTGTGIVPPASFTLQPGDEVEIDGGPLGVLRNPARAV